MISLNCSRCLDLAKPISKRSHLIRIHVLLMVSSHKHRMQATKRAAVICATIVIMSAMTLVPPWKSYQIHILHQGQDVEVRQLAAYAWYDQPPPSKRKGHGYTINYDLLWLQELATGLAGTWFAFGWRGLVVYILVCVGGYLGAAFPSLIIPKAKPHAGWDSPIVIVIAGVTCLIGAAIRLMIAISVIKACSFLEATKPARTTVSTKQKRRH